MASSLALVAAPGIVPDGSACPLTPAWPFTAAGLDSSWGAAGPGCVCVCVSSPSSSSSSSSKPCSVSVSGLGGTASSSGGGEFAVPYRAHQLGGASPGRAGMQPAMKRKTGQQQEIEHGDVLLPNPSSLALLTLPRRERSQRHRSQSCLQSRAGLARPFWNRQQRQSREGRRRRRYSWCSFSSCSLSSWCWRDLLITARSSFPISANARSEKAPRRLRSEGHRGKTGQGKQGLGRAKQERQGHCRWTDGTGELQAVMWPRCPSATLGQQSASASCCMAPLPLESPLWDAPWVVADWTELAGAAAGEDMVVCGCKQLAVLGCWCWWSAFVAAGG